MPYVGSPPPSHSREFHEYLFDSQPNTNMLMLIDALMGNMHILSQHLSSSTTEDENTRVFHDFMINEFGKNMPAEQYRRWWLEVWVSRIVDAFQVYLSEILLRIYTEKPEILKSSENKVDVRDVLEAGSIDEFTRWYAEQKASGLAYKGLRDLIEYMNKTFKIKFDTSNEDFQAACEIVGVRNIIVHNRGRINKTFLGKRSKKANEGLQEGELYPLDFRYALDANNQLRRFVEELDLKIVGHFNLDPSLKPRTTKSRTFV